MPTEERICSHCRNSKRLSQRGIAAVYLKPHWWAVLLMLVGVVMAILSGAGWLWFSVLAYVLPLAMADLRLLLYPWVAIGALMGRKANCPICEPSGGVWRRF